MINPVYKMTLNDRCAELCDKIQRFYDNYEIKRNLRSGSIYLSYNKNASLYNSFIELTMDLGEIVLDSILYNEDNVFNHDDFFTVLLVDKYTYGNLYGITSDEKEKAADYICRRRCNKSFEEDCKNICGLKR